MPVYRFNTPVEQLNITQDLTEYCWYTFTTHLNNSITNTSISIDSATANSLIIFIDGNYKGTCYDQTHQWTTNPWQCSVYVGDVNANAVVSILSVSLGIENGMDSGEIPYENHWKGLNPNGHIRLGNLDITAKLIFTVRPYLTGEFLSIMTRDGHANVPWSTTWQSATGVPLTWYYTTFPVVPLPTQGLYSVLIDMSGMGRGHAYINGHDIGRYWLINGGDKKPTQSLYHIPQDWLKANGDNTLTIIEELGSSDPSKVQVVVSQMLPSEEEFIVEKKVQVLKPKMMRE